ncbi:MAG: peptidylprolyl isomerase [Limisphaerales bacterium]
MHPQRAILLLGLLLTLTASQPALAAQRIINGFAAIVGDKVITFQDVDLAVRPNDLEVARLRFGNSQRDYDQELSRLRQAALIGHIATHLIIAEFNTAGYQLPENIVEEQIKDRIREQYGDRVRLMRTLQAENTTYETFKQRVRERFIVEAMTAKNISSAILISPYKIEKYYQEHLEDFQVKDRVKLSMISLWNKVDRNSDATKQLARDVAQQLQQGASFPEVASLYSDDPRRRDGGERGWIERGSADLREDLQSYAFSLTPEQPSDPLECEEGCYIMLVTEKQEARTRPLIEARDEIEAIISQNERAKLREKWIDRLRDKTFVRLFPMN